MSELSRGTYLVYETIERCATENKCHLSYNTLARISGYSRSFVIAAVRELILLGWVEKCSCRNAWLGNVANEYLLTKGGRRATPLN